MHADGRLRHFHVSFFATVMGMAGLTLKTLQVVLDGSVFQPD